MLISLLKNILYSIISMLMLRSALTGITGQQQLMLLIIRRKPGRLIMAEGEVHMIMKEGRQLLLLPPDIYGIRLSIKDQATETMVNLLKTIKEPIQDYCLNSYQSHMKNTQALIYRLQINIVSKYGKMILIISVLRIRFLHFS